MKKKTIYCILVFAGAILIMIAVVQFRKYMIQQATHTIWDMETKSEMERGPVKNLF